MPIEGVQQHATKGRPEGRRDDNTNPEYPHGAASLVDGKDLKHQDHGQRLHQARTGAL